MIKIFPLLKFQEGKLASKLDFEAYTNGFAFYDLIEGYGKGNIKGETVFEFPDGSSILLMYGDDDNLLGIADIRVKGQFGPFLGEDCY